MHAAATPSRKTKLSCETSLKNEKVQDVKTKLSCEAKLSWFRSKRKVEDMKTKLSCETSFKKSNFNLWKSAVPQRGRSEHDRPLAERVPQPSRGKPSPLIFRDTFCPAKKAFRASAVSQKRISCQTSLEICQLTMWKRSLRATLPSKFESWRCESEAFVRDFPQSVKVKDVKTKISRARIPSKTEGWS